MKKNEMKAFTLVLTALVFASANAVGDVRILKVPMGTSGDWNVATNWTGDLLPVAADNTYVRDGRTANVYNDVGTVSRLYIGGQFGTNINTGTVNIQSGKLAVSSAYIEVGRRGQTAGAVGTLNISGGTFQAGDSSGSVAVTIGSYTTGGATVGLLEVSGTGTFVGRAIVGSSTAGGSGEDILRIVGSNVTVGNTSTAGSNSIDVRDSGSLEWIFDAAGIATASFQENITFSGGSSGIVVDGNAYTGGAQTFTLLTTAGNIAGTAPTITLTGFAAGTTYDWDTVSDVFTVTTIPEPATLGLLGGSAAMMIMVRRFRI